MELDDDDEPNPRRVPKCTSFPQIPVKMTVPEVSLIFNAPVGSKKEGSEKSYKIEVPSMRRKHYLGHTPHVGQMQGHGTHQTRTIESELPDNFNYCYTSKAGKCIENTLPTSHSANTQQYVLKRSVKSVPPPLCHTKVGSQEPFLHVQEVNIPSSKIYHDQKFSEDLPAKEDSLSIAALYQAQCTTNKETTKILSQLFEVNQTQCRVLQEILHKLNGLQVDHQNLLVEIKNQGSTEVKVKKVSTVDQATSCCPVSDLNLTDKSTQTKQDTEQNLGAVPDKVTEEKCGNEQKAQNLFVKNQEPVRVEYCTRESHHVIPPERQVSPDESLTLHGMDMITISEQIPSPMPSLHLDMKDFHESSSDEEENSNSDEGCSIGIRNVHQEGNRASWTLYDNVVCQVNKFLQTSPLGNQKLTKKPLSSLEDVPPAGGLQRKGASVEAIRTATIEQIRKLGVSIYEESTEIKEVSTRRVKFDPMFRPHMDWQGPGSGETDTSFQDNTLAHKYLKDDQLSESTSIPMGLKGMRGYNADRHATNMSLATQRYLEKYHIIPENTPDDSLRTPSPTWESDEAQRKRAGEERIHGVGRKGIQSIPQHSKSNRPTEKILDITSLKQLPKLL